MYEGKPEYVLDTNFKYAPAELNIMNITHTWKLMEQKVKQEIQTSRKISPKKPVM